MFIFPKNRLQAQKIFLPVKKRFFLSRNRFGRCKFHLKLVDTNSVNGTINDIKPNDSRKDGVSCFC